MRLGFGARMLVTAATVGVCGVVLSFGHASAGHVAARHAMHHALRVTDVRHVARTSARRLQQPPVVTPCTTCKPAKAAGKTRLRLHRPYMLRRLFRRPWWLRMRWRRRWHPLWWLGF